jgi:thymidylate synthase
MARRRAVQPVDFLKGHANQWYVDVAEVLINDGQPVVSRGRAVHEALHTQLRMPDPRKRVLTIPFRRANPFFQAAEAVWILAGRADAQWILPYNRQLRQFLDTAVPRPGYFHGAYGERLRRWDHISKLGEPPGPEVDQLQHVLDQLRKDSGSRRAVAVLHNPRIDNPWHDTLDRPCNIALSFQQRDGALHAMTFNRSNDLTLGLAYTNIVQFTTIQEFLAAGLKLGVGLYTHISSSLHIYDDDAVARRCLKLGARYRFDVYDHVSPVAMKPWASASEGFDLMERLAGQQCPPLECPYWESVRGLLEVWGVLKLATAPESQGDHAERAAVKLLALPAQDWGIAALEFLYRWARNRKVERHVLAVVADAKLPDPVARFIAHDTAMDPVLSEG